jgi:cysteine desulfurase/selenocysteine lyase
MIEPPVKKTLYWCDQCNIPLIGRTCACRNEGIAIHLLEPYDVRPALAKDRDLISGLVHTRFGPVPIPRVLLLNKAGGLDRNDLIIANGTRFGWLSFDPVERVFRFDPSPEALPFILPHAKSGILDLEQVADLEGTRSTRGRIGGKKFKVTTSEPDGTLFVKYRGRYGTAVLHDGWLRVKEVMPVTPVSPKDPGWDEVVEKNRYHLKNLERNAIRAIKQHMKDRPVVNVSFSGGKDSTAVLLLARKAGVKDAFFIDTGIEFPETVEFVRSMGVEVVNKAGDFWAAVEKVGPPAKDNRWCCKLLKQNPLRLHLAKTGPCVTVQGNRWYESWNRADLELAVQNPLNPLQLNISPIRNWRALEVFLYLWWQKANLNPLYDEGIERIGCYPCPSMLESEFSGLSRLHPDLASSWLACLLRWADKKGLPEEYARFGLWRWKGLPNKMQELCRQHQIVLRETPDGVTVAQLQDREKGQEKPLSPAASTGTIKSDSSPGFRITGKEPQISVQFADMDDEQFPGDKNSVAAGEKGDERPPFSELRKDFPLLSEVIYLDSASMSLSPEPVLMAVLEYERNYRALAGKRTHRLGGIATHRYWHAHQKVAEFIGGETGVTVFLKNVTEAIGLVSEGLSWQAGDRVIGTVLVNGSDLIPWQKLTSINLEIIPLLGDFTPDLTLLEENLSTGNARLVVVPHVPDAIGVISPIGEIARICHESGAFLLVDGSHSVPHIPVDVRELGVDFFCFSGHTLFAPTGTGVLWIRDPGTLPRTTKNKEGISETETEMALKPFERFESGTPNISGGIGLGAAVDYLKRAGMERIRAHDMQLTDKLVRGLRDIEKVTVYGPSKPGCQIGNVSFNIGGVDPYEVARYLDEEADIMIKAGFHDCAVWMETMGLKKGTVRASISLYNNETDIESLIATVAEISRGT